MLISKFSTHSVETHIALLEQKLHITLPAQYKSFLLRYNGGYTPKTGFTSRNISSDLRGFFGVGDVGLSLNDMPLAAWVENNMFPVACDSFGNLVLVSVCEDSFGQLYFHDHENGKNTVFLATDLREFLNCCKSEKISQGSRRSIKEREEALIAKGRGDIITDALRQLWQAEIDKYGNLTQEEVLLD